MSIFTEKKDSQGYTEAQRLNFLKQIAQSHPLVQALYLNSSQDASAVMEKKLIEVAKNFQVPVSQFQQVVGELAQSNINEDGGYNG
ncbi:MAG: hypothetical protein LAT82_05345 [Nanoarchaeota archaeon]|nr:hypothetical protein [Nanoarchaeota archaeon]